MLKASFFFGTFDMGYIVQLYSINELITEIKRKIGFVCMRIYGLHLMIIRK